MKLFNEQLPFQLSDLISLKLDQDGRKVALKATLSYADGEGTPASWVSTDPDEIADLRTICEFGDIPIEITAPAHLKPKAAAFPLPQSKVDGLHKAFIESEIPPGAGCTLHQVIAKHSNYTVSDAICNELEAVRPGHIRIGALMFRNDTDMNRYQAIAKVSRVAFDRGAIVRFGREDCNIYAILNGTVIYACALGFSPIGELKSVSQKADIYREAPELKGTVPMSAQLRPLPAMDPEPEEQEEE